MFMALLVLCSTVSVTVEKHFCGGTLVDVGVFTPANKCCSDTSSSVQTSQESHCCNDVVDFVEGQDELLLASNDEFNKFQAAFFSAVIISYVQLFENLPKKNLPNYNYVPPNLVHDMHILHKVFLI